MLLLLISLAMASPTYAIGRVGGAPARLTILDSNTDGVLEDISSGATYRLTGQCDAQRCVLHTEPAARSAVGELALEVRGESLTGTWRPPGSPRTKSVVLSSDPAGHLMVSRSMPEWMSPRPVGEVRPWLVPSCVFPMIVLPNPTLHKRLADLMAPERVLPPSYSEADNVHYSLVYERHGVASINYASWSVGVYLDEAATYRSFDLWHGREIGLDTFTAEGRTRIVRLVNLVMDSLRPALFRNLLEWDGELILGVAMAASLPGPDFGFYPSTAGLVVPIEWGLPHASRAAAPANEVTIPWVSLRDAMVPGSPLLRISVL